MSWRALMAVRFAKVDMTAHLLLIDIAFHADDDGRAWLTVGRLAKEGGCGRATVQRALRRLVDAKVIKVTYRPGRSSEFTIAGVPQIEARGASNRGRGASNRDPTLFKEDFLKERAAPVDPYRDPDAEETLPARPASLPQRAAAHSAVVDAKRAIHREGA